MGKRARHRTPGGRPAPQTGATERAAGTDAGPERLLLQAVADGELDHSLAALAAAIEARVRLLETVHSATALAHLNVGDEVRVNASVRPRYLQGARGTVVALEHDRVTIRLHRPTGRYVGEVRCSPLALDRLGQSPVAAA